MWENENIKLKKTRLSEDPYNPHISLLRRIYPQFCILIDFDHIRIFPFLTNPVNEFPEFSNFYKSNDAWTDCYNTWLLSIMISTHWPSTAEEIV